MSTHPRIKHASGDEKLLLEEQRRFMESKTKPAARVIRTSSATTRDVITLNDDSPGSPGTTKPNTPDRRPPSRFRTQRNTAAHLASQPTTTASDPATTTTTAANPDTTTNPTTRSTTNGTDKYDTAGVISNILEREYGTTALETKYVPPTFTQSTGSTGFPETFKTSTTQPSRFRRKETTQKMKKQRSVFASMMADAREKAAEEEEMKETERAFSNGFSTPSQDAAEIHAENSQRLAKMSPKEIEEARQSLLKSLSPAAVAVLKQRGSKRNNKKKGHLTSSRSVPLNPMPAPPQTSTLINSDTNSEGVVDLTTLHNENELLTVARDKTRSLLDRAKLDWTKDVPVPTRPSVLGKEVRFNLDGDTVQPNDDPQQLLGLHHHGRNPTSAGYAIDELLHLSRSTHDTQRTMALRTITKVLRKRAKALLQFSATVSPAALPIETHTVLLMSIHHIASNPLIHSMREHAMSALHAWLVPPGDMLERSRQEDVWSSSCLNHVILPPTVHAQHDRSLQECRLDTDVHSSGETDFLTNEENNSFNMAPVTKNEEEEEEEQKKGASRPVYWLMRHGLLKDLCRIMRVSAADQDVKTFDMCLDILSFCARHSMASAAVIAASNTIKCLRDISLEFTDRCPICTVGCLRLIRLLCCSSRSVVERFQRDQLLTVIHRFVLVSSVDGDDVGDDVVVESLKIMRVCIEYGIEVMETLRVFIEFSNRHANPRHNAVVIARLNIIETLSRYLGKEAESRSSLTVEEKGQVEHYVETCHESILQIIQAKWHDSRLVGAACHVLASSVSSIASNKVQLLKNIFQSVLRSKHAIASATSAVTNGMVTITPKKDTDTNDGESTPELSLEVYGMLHGIFRALRIVADTTDAYWCKLAKTIALTTLKREASDTSITSFSSCADNNVTNSTRHEEVLGGYARRVVVHATVEMMEYLSSSQLKEQHVSAIETMNAALVLLPMCMPGDEFLVKSLLSKSLLSTDSLEALWYNNEQDKNASNKKRRKKELLELRTVLMNYYVPFLGDVHYLERSARRWMTKDTATTRMATTTLYLAPRVREEQQSTLPLPTHWLYLPLVSEEGEEEWNDLSTSVASLTYLWRLECHTSLGVLGLSTMSVQQRMYTIMRVAADSTEQFLFENVTSTVLYKMLCKCTTDFQSISTTTKMAMTIEQVCGRVACLSLAARVARRYLNDPRCHSSMFYLHVMYCLLSTFYFQGDECRRSIWSVSTEARLSHTLENVYALTTTTTLKMDNKKKSAEIVQYYATALTDTIGTRREYCPHVYHECLSTVASYIFFGDLTRNLFGRRQVGLSIIRSKKMDIVNEVLKYDAKDGKSPEERREWLMKEKE